MRATSLLLLCALAGCNFRLDPLGVGAGGSDGSVRSADAGLPMDGDLGAGAGDDLAHQGPFLEIAAVPAASSVDLTIDGNADWAHWGYSSASDFDHKMSGSGQISNFQ